MRNKVLILSASVGAGHLRAADAVEKAMAAAHPEIETTNIDVLEYTNPLFRRLYGKLYLDLVKRMPDALGWIYDSLDKPWQKERRRLALDRLNTQPLIRLLIDEDPDIAICTHFLPAEIISWLRAKKKITTRQAVVVTDFDAHALWLCRNYEHYFVPIEETAVYLEKVGIRKEDITVSGIPIDPVFAIVKNKFETREKLGLKTDLLTIMVSAGGFGVGNVEILLKALAEMKTECQIVAICGRNEELRNEVSALAKSLKTGAKARIVPVGFTDAMDEYMSASDLIVGKPGGLTTSEALAKDLVFVIVNPIPGQEERNSDHLLEKGCAVKCNTLPTLAYKIDELAASPARLTSMQANIKSLARPNSASTVANKIIGLIDR
ncbi:MAG: glycosyltransferase [Pyrinomonadaceae bacterium]|nr:glycosyltransferase [Pyrinomonadaceae bacterium]